MSPRERALASGEAVKDPDRRRKLAEDPGIADDLKHLQRLAVEANGFGLKAASPRGGCGKYFETAAACYALAAVREDDSWRETGDAWATVGMACEELQYTLSGSE